VRKLILPLALFFLMLASSCGKKNRDANQQDKAAVFYTCSMHPQVMQPQPGSCPICGMPLTLTQKGNISGDEIQLSDLQIRLGNIQTDTVKKRNMNDESSFSATLSMDQNKITSVSARLMGRIERLYLKNTGDYVRKGEPLYDFYSEELNTVKQEYLLALEKKESLSNSFINYDRIIEGAKNKLLLWGLTESQIVRLASDKWDESVTTFLAPASGFITEFFSKEGDYVMEGSPIVKLADLSTLWAEAQVYESQLEPALQKKDAILSFPDMPGKSIAGKVEFVSPEISPASRISLLRVSVPNSDYALKPGMPAYITLKGTEKNLLALPTDAIINESKGSTVWVKTGQNTFKIRMVETGAENNGLTEIISGLEEGEEVVVTGAYLVNSEYILKKGAAPMATHQH